MNYRFYAFVNFRLIGIHAGIQGGHAAAELFTTENQVCFSAEQKKMIQDWVNNDKTFVFLSGGQSSDLLAAFNRFKNCAYPTALFREEASAFGDDAEGHRAVTAWGIILPESIYDTRFFSAEFGEYGLPFYSCAQPNHDQHYVQGNVEYDILEYKSQFRLAV